MFSSFLSTSAVFSLLSFFLYYYENAAREFSLHIAENIYREIMELEGESLYICFLDGMPTNGNSMVFFPSCLSHCLLLPFTPASCCAKGWEGKRDPNGKLIFDKLTLPPRVGKALARNRFLIGCGVNNYEFITLRAQDCMKCFASPLCHAREH